MTSGPTTQKDGWRVLLTSCPTPPTPKWRNDAVIARCASSGAGIGRDRIPGRRGLCRASRGPLGPAAGVLHIGEGHPRDSMAGFPHDSAVRSRMSVLSGEAPMCRGDRSAHGRASTALSAGAFPHDYANPPPAGPARMCNTARPGPTPHIQVWPRSPRTHFWHRPGPARPGRTSGIASDLTPHHPLRADPPPPEPHPDEKDSFCGRFAGLRPVVLRERAGFQSNAHLPSARSTGNLRARGESGASRRNPGTGETPGTGPGAEILPRLRSRGPGGVIGASARPGGVIQAGAGSAARPADALPGRPEDAGCQNLPQRPRPSRSAPEETLIFRASARRRSRRRAPLWQIRTRPHPGSPQEPHPPHHSNAPQQRTSARNSDASPAGRRYY